MPLEQAKERATQLQSEVTLLERYSSINEFPFNQS